jgi:hypothetical protein
MTEIATLGGGCFWCLEAVYRETEGVEKVVSGYMGGSSPNPTYKDVCSGTTGHVEIVQLTFDPNVISYRDILEVFFVIHDPTTLNQQGNDIGTQYRSVIFYHSRIYGGEGFRGAGGYRDRTGAGVLSGGSIPSGILREPSLSALLRVRGCAQGAEVPEEIRGTSEIVQGLTPTVWKPGLCRMGLRFL